MVLPLLNLNSFPPHRSSHQVSRSLYSRIRHRLLSLSGYALKALYLVVYSSSSTRGLSRRPPLPPRPVRSSTGYVTRFFSQISWGALGVVQELFSVAAYSLCSTRLSARLFHACRNTHTLGCYSLYCGTPFGL